MKNRVHGYSIQEQIQTNLSNELPKSNQTSTMAKLDEMDYSVNEAMRNFKPLLVLARKKQHFMVCVFHPLPSQHF